MGSLKFATGLQTFEVNDSAKIRFNPTDSFFVEKLHSTFKKLQEEQDEYKAELDRIKTEDSAHIFDFCRKKDEEMRALIDSCFDEPVCHDVFGHLNVYAFADGFPIWANFVLAIFDVIEECGDKEEKKMHENIKKYVEKYKGK